MKKTTKIFGLLLTLFGLALVTGCTPITDTPYVPEETTYTVTFKDGDTIVDSQTVKSGEKVTKPVDPTKEGCDFGGWYISTDDGETFSETAFDFDTEIKADITLYVKWNETTTEPAPEDDSEVNPGDELSESGDDNPDDLAGDVLISNYTINYLANGVICSNNIHLSDNAENILEEDCTVSTFKNLWGSDLVIVDDTEGFLIIASDEIEDGDIVYNLYEFNISGTVLYVNFSLSSN